jgi:peroxiredoxin
VPRTVRIGPKEANVIGTGEKAPGFTLKDQFQREISLSQFSGRRHVLLLFYPLDYTPT